MLRKRLQSTCLALMGLGEVTTLEESQLEELRMGELKNGKAAVKDEITGEMIKDGGDGVVDCIWRLCNMAFENGVVPEDWIVDSSACQDISKQFRIVGCIKSP